MLYNDKISATMVVAVTIIMLICLIVVLTCVRFSKKQQKKYKEMVKLVNENKHVVVSENNQLTNPMIDEIIMMLYNKYLLVIDKVNNNDKNFDNLLVDFIKELYENKIDVFISKNHNETITNIELNNYSLIKYENNKIEFRINITCIRYGARNGKIIRGTNREKINQIIILSGVNQNNEWLINNIDQVYQKTE